MLLAILLLLPIVEIYVLVQVGQEIGFWATAGVVVLAGIIGARLAAVEGAGALRRVNAAVADGRLPAQEIAEGVVVLVAGLLLVFPGFVSDVAGLVILFPPVRRALGGRVLARTQARGPLVVRHTVIRTARDPDEPPPELEP